MSSAPTLQKVIFDPSGDQEGSPALIDEPFVSLVWLEPSASITQISLGASPPLTLKRKAIFDPSGDQEGEKLPPTGSGEELFVRFVRLEPSVSITQMSLKTLKLPTLERKAIFDPSGDQEGASA